MADTLSYPAERMFHEPSGSDAWAQDDRLLSIDTPLGKDYLLLTSVDGEEALSSLYGYEVGMMSTDLAIAAELLIGKPVRICIRGDDETPRYIHGMVAQFRAGPITNRNRHSAVDEELRWYSAQVVPWLWFLQHSTDCRIFQNLNVPDIIAEVFATFGCTDYQMAVSRADYPKLEFCVQYRETAFNFVSRLMEQVGIFYWFRHDDDRHVMVLSDSNTAFRQMPGPPQVYGGGGLQAGNVTKWEHRFAFRPGRWAQTDFNFETPSGDLGAAETTVLKLPTAAGFERFDYPGGYFDKALGTKLTRTLMEAEEAAYHAVDGAGSNRFVQVGGKFTLQRHPLEEEATVYVISRVRHQATDNSILNENEAPRYDNVFEAIRHDVQFRPKRMTEKPFVHGPQTAMVVGPAGEKIFTDKYGRVRVHFHWDRYNPRDDKSSCWIRVSQSWGGRGWGAVNLPHVGHEVIVSFLEGDPDRPLITGRVYNGENMTAMGMPDNKTQSAMRDHSGNEIVMEGKTGSEDIRVNATKDTNVTITHDYNETVKTGNRTINVNTGTHTEKIKGDTRITITTGSLAITVAANTATYTSQKTTTMNSTTADVHIVAKTQIALDVGASHLLMKEDGTIEMSGKTITIHGSDTVNILGDKTIKASGDSIGISGGSDTKIGVGGQNTMYDKQKLANSGAAISSAAVGQHEITGAIVKIN